MKKEVSKLHKGISAGLAVLGIGGVAISLGDKPASGSEGVLVSANQNEAACNAPFNNDYKSALSKSQDNTDEVFVVGCGGLL